MTGSGSRELQGALRRAGTPAAALRSLMASLVASFGSADKATLALRRDPYAALLDVRGGTVELADGLAGVFRTVGTQDRLVGHVAWLLRDRSQRGGHTGVEKPLAVARLRFALGMPAVTIQRSLDDAVASGRLVDVDGVLTTARSHAVDVRVAEDIVRRTKAHPNADVAAALLRGCAGLTSEQQDAARTVGGSCLSVITGGPGTGKTVVVRAMVEACAAAGLSVRATAPTGRAARNTQGGRTVAYFRTVHDFKKSREDDDDTALVIVDEASMLCRDLMRAVLDVSPPRAHIVLVGDVDQLPPVGSGDVLRAVMDTGVCPVATLRTNFRNRTAIQAFAAAILRGDGGVPEGGGGDHVRIVACDTQEEAMQAAAVLFQGTPVLTPRNATRLAFNRASQLWRWSKEGGMEVELVSEPGAPAGVAYARGGDDGDGKLTILGDGGIDVRSNLEAGLKLVRARQCDGVSVQVEDGALVARQMDRVLVTRNHNDRDVCNGDVGILVSVAAKRDDDAVVQFEGGRVEQVPVRDLTLAYAMTVHKAQGSEFEVVVLPVTDTAAWDRSLLYTAVTRAKDRVVLLGTAEALRRILTTPARPPRTCTLRSALARCLVGDVN
jgi:exodeoxyribonuclease V alpha subunit